MTGLKSNAKAERTKQKTKNQDRQTKHVREPGIHFPDGAINKSIKTVEQKHLREPSIHFPDGTIN